MLNPQTYETPDNANEVDPGEAPPGRPSRRVSAETSGHLEEPVPTIDEVRSSAARLLQDAEERVSPPTVRKVNPFDRAGSSSVHDQLPSVEEARLYAGRILGSSDQKLSNSSLTEPLKMGRTTTLSGGHSYEPSRGHGLSKRRICYGLAIVVAIAAIIGVAVGVSKSSSGDSSSAVSAPTGMTPALQEILTFLEQNEISEPSALYEPRSPQYKAAAWMANVCELQYPVSLELSTNSRFLQRYALTTFYYSLDGDNWDNKLNFLQPEEDECAWYEHITLGDGENIALGVTCGESLMVEALLITNNRLAGDLPYEMVYLNSLDFMDLKHNSITGILDNNLGKLERMSFVDMRYNNLGGEIPHWMGLQWKKLTVLALSHNQFTGTLPQTLGQATALKTLALDDNKLEGDMMVLNPLRNLEFLYLDNNELTGTVDEDFLRPMSSLVHLDLSSNILTGKLSHAPHFFTMSALKVLDLHDNDLTGSMFDGDLTEDNEVLEYLSVYDNVIEGTLPQTIFHLKKIKHLDVTGNELVGRIPDTFPSMTDLSYLFLSNNAWDEGPFPEDLSTCTNLRELSLSTSSRTGTIPKWIDQLENLVLLDLSINKFGGTIPDNLWDIPNLHYVLLNRNDLTGIIPSAMHNAPSLNMVMLDKNDLQGDLSQHCSMPQLQFMSSDCEGNDPEVKCSCCHLCCRDDDPNCNDNIMYANLDLQWEQNYTRMSYAFSPGIIFDNQ
eukprot:CAMPEP_0194033670 /NCGR_PEP_ID=MMETSP0009_2-20130614/6263_1 /TAXON_ID=210454 /ORGANISM="Grammatophora oceanica, Strain CCMP 410" /LENGTH=723 /DNA_ID=CAMNT_0038674387 /DNA_START=157 /DNA_END=2328 /DNA_ORIENTATION=+